MKKRKRCELYIKSRRECDKDGKGCQFKGYEFRKNGKRACFKLVKKGIL